MNLPFFKKIYHTKLVFAFPEIYSKFCIFTLLYFLSVCIFTVDVTVTIILPIIHSILVSFSLKFSKNDTLGFRNYLHKELINTENE